MPIDVSKMIDTARISHVVTLNIAVRLMSFELINGIRAARTGDDAALNNAVEAIHKIEQELAEQFVEISGWSG